MACAATRRARRASVPWVCQTIPIGKNFVFTHHSMPMRSLEELAADLDRNPRLLDRGPAFVAHAIVDRLTDQYLPVVDEFEEEIDEIEEQVINRPRPEHLRRLFALKRSLQRLRRISAYQRDVLLRLSREEFELIPTAAVPFFRDVYDHFVRIADLADSYRELVTAALEIYMSGVANRTNDISNEGAGAHLDDHAAAQLHRRRLRHEL